MNKRYLAAIVAALLALLSLCSALPALAKMENPLAEDAARIALPTNSEKNSSSLSNLKHRGTMKNHQTAYGLPEDAVEYNGHYYCCIEGFLFWEDALVSCSLSGGYPATISSEEENDFVFSLMVSQGYNEAYFGFTDEYDEGECVWVNGEEVTYTNWHDGEPNGYVWENYCMYYSGFADGTWNDGDFYPGETGAVIICEWDSESEPPKCNENDFVKLRTFLETEDDDGITNGEKINLDYNPEVPASWTAYEYYYDDETGDVWYESYGVIWEFEDGELRLYSVRFDGLGVVGVLDLSNCDSLQFVYCEGNRLVGIDVTNCGMLLELCCSYNCITEIIISGSEDLYLVQSRGNRTKELIFPGDDCLWYDSIRAEGSGTIGIDWTYFEGDDEMTEIAIAQPDAGAEFLGWYSETGVFISDEEELIQWHYPRVVARFSEVSFIPGDADDNGIVDTTDALYVLRCALGISGNPDDLIPHCDMDGNNDIDTTDALLILRIALGIG